ncbi:MAG: alpha/beta hydrolase [Solobacterium sp.]|nr:alpha/beta hydrolase [Solobacterium sp.]
MKITPETKLNEIYQNPLLKKRAYMLGRFPGFGGIMSSQMKIRTLCNMVKTWNPESVAEGYQMVIDRAEQKQIFFDIYHDERAKTTGITAFTLEKKSPFVVVCAGGGYASVCSMVEAFPVIQKLNEAGYAAFSLQYRCGKDAKAPAPMDDLAAAIRYILDHAQEFNVETEGYAVMGFSAGGHLAASFGTASLGYRHYGLTAPSAMILCYPVITMGEKTHAGSKNCLLGKKASAEIIRRYSVEEQITPDYPPAFVWQFDADNMVPVENTKMLVQALEKNHIEHEYVLYPGTIHGAGSGEGTAAEGWMEQALAFLNSHR